MAQDQILYAETPEALLFKLSGDLRHTGKQGVDPSLALDSFIAGLFNGHAPAPIVIDLSEAVRIDSTHLGILAQLASLSLQQWQQRPLIVCPAGSIRDTLHTMGFDSLFNYVDAAPPAAPEMSAVTAGDARGAGEVVLDAHRALAALSEANQAAFKDLIALLEQQAPRKNPR